MNYLLYISVGYLIITTIIFLQNRTTFTPLLSDKDHIFTDQSPSVSICIPARNEERGIERCIRSALSQKYPNVDVLVLDDESTDQTLDILQTIKKTNSQNLRILQGDPKPADWLGKPWACHQLSQHTQSDIIIFIDADTWLEPETVGRVVRTMGHDVLDLLTIWPEQKLGSFWEKIVIPLIYHTLLTLLPARYVYKAPRWIPPPLRKQLTPLFAAACGQFMAFKKKAYKTIGGHHAIQAEIVDDVVLAKNVKKKGLTMRMYYGKRSVTCRMYTSAKKMYYGFRKNFLAGFNKNLILFTLMAILQAVVFILPYCMLLIGLFIDQQQWIWLSALAISLIIGQRLLLDLWFGWNILAGLLHPLGVLWFQRLGVTVLQDYYAGKNVQWKDRWV